jgi:hypothetical protein
MFPARFRSVVKRARFRSPDNWAGNGLRRQCSLIHVISDSGEPRRTKHVPAVRADILASFEEQIRGMIVRLVASWPGHRHPLDQLVDISRVQR